MYLNAYDLNTMLQSRDIKKGLRFDFQQRPEGAEFANEFTARDYEVVDPVGKNSLSLGTKADKLVEIEDAKEWLEIATDNYISKLEELESANASLQDVFGELIKLENNVKELTVKQGEKQVEEDDAKKALKEAQDNYDLIEQSIKDLPADEDLQKQLAEASEALGKAKEKMEAWEKQQADLKQKVDAAYGKWKEAYNAWASAGPNEKDELKDVEQSALETYLQAQEALDKLSEDDYENLKVEVEKYKKSVDDILAQMAEGSDLKDQLKAATNALNDAKNALDKIQAELSEIGQVLTEYELKKAEVSKEVNLANSEVYALMQEVWIKEATKNVACQAVRNAYKAYIAVLHFADYWYSLKNGNNYLMVRHCLYGIIFGRHQAPEVCDERTQE